MSPVSEAGVGADLARPFIARCPGAPGPSSPEERRKGGCGGAASPAPRRAARLRGAAARAPAGKRGSARPPPLPAPRGRGGPSVPRLSPPLRPAETFPSAAGSRLGRGGGRPPGRAEGACQAFPPATPCPAGRAAR